VGREEESLDIWREGVSMTAKYIGERSLRRNPRLKGGGKRGSDREGGGRRGEDPTSSIVMGPHRQTESWPGKKEKAGCGKHVNLLIKVTPGGGRRGKCGISSEQIENHAAI